jgi:hypothetical protein
MSAGGAVAAFFLVLVLAVLAFFFGVAIINWNVNDIIQHGVNFWNVFWLSLVAVTWFGGGSAAGKS